MAVCKHTTSCSSFMMKDFQRGKRGGILSSDLYTQPESLP